MTVATSYTEDAFKDYLQSVLRELATVLGWTAMNGDFDEPLAEAVLAMGETDITAISGITAVRKLKAAGRVEVWRVVMSATAGDYDFRQPDGAQYSRSQVHAQAEKMFNQALKDARQLGVTAYSPSTVTLPPSGSAKIDYAQGAYKGASV